MNLCACGCGQEVKPARKTHYGEKGKPYKFLCGHNRKGEKDNIPYGYCHCGCGGKTTICDRQRLYRKGGGTAYLNGHNKINEAKAWARERKINKLLTALQEEGNDEFNNI
jgi:hypothetical protein